MYRSLVQAVKLFPIFSFSISGVSVISPRLGFNTMKGSAAILLLFVLPAHTPQTHTPACLFLLSSPGVLPLTCTGISICGAMPENTPGNQPGVKIK